MSIWNFDVIKGTLVGDSLQIFAQHGLEDFLLTLEGFHQVVGNN